MDFRAKAEGGGVEIAEQAIEQGRLLLEKGFDGVVIEIGGGDGGDELELDEFVARDIAGFEHGGFAEEIALEIGVAKIPGFVEVGLGFHFFGEKGDAAAGELFGNALAAFGIEKREIHFQVVGEFDEGLEAGVTEKIVEGEEVAVLTEFAAEIDDFAGRFHAFENFDDDAIGRKQAWSAEAQRHFVDVDEGAGGSGEGLQIEEGEGIGDDAGGGVIAGLKEILWAAAEEEFVGVDPQAFVEDGLAGDEFFVHGRHLALGGPR